VCDYVCKSLCRCMLVCKYDVKESERGCTCSAFCRSPHVCASLCAFNLP